MCIQVSLTHNLLSQPSLDILSLLWQIYITVCSAIINNVQQKASLHPQHHTFYLFTDHDVKILYLQTTTYVHHYFTLIMTL